MTYVDKNLSPISQDSWVYEDVQYPKSIFTIYNDSQLKSIGIFKVYIDDYTVPEGKYVAGFTYEWVNDNVKGFPVFEDVPTPLQQRVVDGAQKRLDDFARTRNYDGILSACTYATSNVPKFASEGQYAVEVRDSTWKKLYEILDEVQSGKRPIPTGFADIEPELPTLEWPL